MLMIMQAIGETSFDIVYLVTVITIGILMIRKSNGNKQFCLFGIMAVVLGAGDSFHLIPVRWLFAQPDLRAIPFISVLVN